MKAFTKAHIEYAKETGRELKDYVSSSKPTNCWANVYPMKTFSEVVSTYVSVQQVAKVYSPRSPLEGPKNDEFGSIFNPSEACYSGYSRDRQWMKMAPMWVEGMMEKMSGDAIEHNKPIISYILNDSPLADTFITKDPDEVFDHGVIRDTRNSPAMVFTAGGHMLRNLWEHADLAHNWTDWLQYTDNKNVAFVLAIFSGRPRGDYLVTSLEARYHCWLTPYWTMQAISNWVNNNHVFWDGYESIAEGGSYNGQLAPWTKPFLEGEEEGPPPPNPKSFSDFMDDAQKQGVVGEHIDISAWGDKSKFKVFLKPSEFVTLFEGELNAIQERVHSEPERTV